MMAIYIYIYGHHSHWSKMIPAYLLLLSPNSYPKHIQQTKTQHHCMQAGEQPEVCYSLPHSQTNTKGSPHMNSLLLILWMTQK